MVFKYATPDTSQGSQNDTNDPSAVKKQSLSAYQRRMAKQKNKKKLSPSSYGDTSGLTDDSGDSTLSSMRTSRKQIRY